jgi:LysM repeat protein
MLAAFFVFLALTFAIGQQQEQTYIVRKGDTLWDLAFKFLGDPFMWTKIADQNPQVKNPDLIYPGNQLVIVPGAALATGAQTQVMQSQTSAYASQPNQSSQVLPAGDTASQNVFASETQKALSESEQAAKKTWQTDSVMAREAWFSDSLFRAAMQKRTYFTSDFQEKVAFLWFKQDEKGLILPGNAYIEKKNDNNFLKKYEVEVYKQFDEIIIRPVGSATYKVGDTVDIFRADQIIKFGDNTANCVRRIGLATITSVKGDSYFALLFKMWDIVQSGDRVEGMAHFTDLQIDSVISPGVSVKGTVFLRVENTERPYLYHTFVLDRGTNDGVTVGDLFAVLSKKESVANRPSAVACVVHANETSSTLVIEKLFSNNVDVGDTAVAIRRVTFKH